MVAGIAPGEQQLVTARTAPVSTAPSTPAPVRVRTAGPDDAPALAAFAARAFTETYARPPAGVTAADAVAASAPEDVAAYVTTHFTPDHQRAELGDAALVTLVAAVADDPWAGYAQLRLRPEAHASTPAVCAGAHPRELSRLYVAPAWHGRGVAVALMDVVQARACAEPGGADPLWLAVYQANARAVAFYRRRGFVLAGASTFTMGRELQHDWLMTWHG